MFQRIFLIVFFLAFNATAKETSSSINRCNGSLSNDLVVSSKDLGFSQDVLGESWGRTKQEKIAVKFVKWLESQGKVQKEANDDLRIKFIRDHYTAQDPIKVYFDTQGQLHILDNHHDFWALNRFMHNHERKQRQPFDVSTVVLKDYRLTNSQTGKPWSKKEMVKDLVELGWFTIENNDQPSLRDFNKIPNDINKLKDSPFRSYVSMAMAATKVTYKTKTGKVKKIYLTGSDFKPMFQFRLANLLKLEGLDADFKDVTDTEAIGVIKDKILNSPHILDFMLADLAPSTKRNRRRRIRSFLLERLEVLEGR